MSEHHPCYKYPNIECRNRMCAKWDVAMSPDGPKEGFLGFYCGEDPHERPTGSTKPEDMTDFQKGVRSFFDSLMFRSANHWSGRPEANEIFQKENKLIQEWAENALEEVSPQSYESWIRLEESYVRGKNVGYSEGLRDAHEDHKAHEEEKSVKRSILFWALAICVLFAGVAAIFK